MSLSPKRVVHRARTAIGLPDRVVGVEDRISALDAHVVTKIDEMRAELAELRQLLTRQLAAETEGTELVGQLLQRSSARLDELEQRIGTPPTSG